MASQKEEPNTSFLFGESTGDDLFSQLQQQQTTPSVEKKDVQQSNKAAGDVSSLFGNNSGGNADLFFSSTNATTNTTPPSFNPQMTSGASAASFFDQNQGSGSFFDNLGQGSQQTQQQQPQQQPQQQQQDQAVPTTQEYDPNAYASYDYSQQQYDQSQWIQFDPNVHYYYDEQGVVHYYDPNTNQEYDMSQYGYEQQSYDYQYDPQYAEYYAQQGYDPNAYAAATTDNSQQAYDSNAYAAANTQQAYDPNAYSATANIDTTQQQQAHVQESYDPNAYAATAEHTQASQNYNTSQEYQQNQSSLEPQANQQESFAQVQDNYDPNAYAAQSGQDFFDNLNSTATIEEQKKEGIVEPQAEATQQQELTQESYDPNAYALNATVNYSQSNQTYEELNNDSVGKEYQHEQLVPESEYQVEDLQQQQQQQQQQPEVYAQDNYDPNAYNLNATADQNQQDQSYYGYTGEVNQNEQQQQQETYAQVQDSYDPNAYAAVDQSQSQYDPNAYSMNYQSQQEGYEQSYTTQGYTTDYNAVAEMPAQTEQTVDDEVSVSKQQDTYDTQSYLPRDYSQQHDFSYQSYEPTTTTVETTVVAEEQNEQTVSYGQDQYAPNNYLDQQYSQVQNDFEEEDLQGNQHQASLDRGVESSQQKSEDLDELDDLVLGGSQQGSLDNAQVISPPPVSNYSVNSVSSPPPPPRANSINSVSLPPRANSISSVSTPPLPPLNSTVNRITSPAPFADTTRVASPPPPPRANSINRVASPPPPPRANSINSVASNPPPPGPKFTNNNNATSPMMSHNTPSYSQQRSYSINETDRSQYNKSPFTDHYNQQAYSIERSATVPPPMTERISSPRPQLVPCPDPQCEGENKPKAKFCCECGRPLAGISRSTTPAANLSSINFGMEPFNASLGAVAQQIQRSALDDRKSAMKDSLSKFVASSTVVQNDRQDQEKRQFALEYINSRLHTFEDGKALLWNVVKLMLEYHENELGDGGELDKSIVQLIYNHQSGAPSSQLDELEDILLAGDREKACEFASERDMWGHCLIIASSLENKDLFKRMVTQFIQKELYASIELMSQVTGNSKSLRFLYSVFNGTDAVSEFVKQTPSDYPVYTEESLEGWKRGLALILANRSTGDQTTIDELGNQLKALGTKNNEARLCYLLSPDVSSLDTSKLVGDDIYSDLDDLYLIELYEFASKKTIQQDFKLVLAWWLTELGFTEESTKYCDSIVNTINNNPESNFLESLNKLGDVTSNESDHVISLLNKQNFDILINSIQEKVNSQTSYGYGYTDQTATGGFSYGYGYENNLPEANNVAISSPFSQPKGIQSPFQNSTNSTTPVQHVSSPFGLQNPNSISSPFGQNYATNTATGGGWWDSNNVETTATATTTEEETNTYQASSYEPQASYQPDAYAPVQQQQQQQQTGASYGLDDEDDDLGFGNSKTRKGAGLSGKQPEDDKITNSTVEEKPNEVDDDKKEPEQKEKAGGWGLFSLFGRGNKEANLDDKKPVKANLGEKTTFYYDEKEKRWVNKSNDAKPVAATPPPPPKSMTPQPSGVATPPPPMNELKPNSMPPPRINSAPTVGGPPSGGPPNVAPPAFNTPPTSNRRNAAGGRKPMRSRYVDVFNTNQS